MQPRQDVLLRFKDPGTENAFQAMYRVQLEGVDLVMSSLQLAFAVVHAVIHYRQERRLFLPMYHMLCTLYYLAVRTGLCSGRYRVKLMFLFQALLLANYVVYLPRFTFNPIGSQKGGAVQLLLGSGCLLTTWHVLIMRTSFDIYMLPILLQAATYWLFLRPRACQHVLAFQQGREAVDKLWQWLEGLYASLSSYTYPADRIPDKAARTSYHCNCVVTHAQVGC